jgi:thiol-disulfide isomerase/thioredoxin
MKRISRTACLCLLVQFLVLPPIGTAATAESAITREIGSLRSLSEAERPRATVRIAGEVSALPAGITKVQLADTLAHLVTEGDQGMDALQAVADALSASLAESPVPPKKDVPPMPYRDLANLVHYEHVATKLTDPLYVRASQELDQNDAEIQKADFTLKDLHGKKYTLSQLRGKIVMVNFWATWCGPRRLEMPNLDATYTHFEAQGLVVLPITDEDPFKVSVFLSPTKYHPPVLLDGDGKVHREFHIGGIPRTFLFDRDGKLLAVTIDQRTQRQFLEMLSKTDLHR